MNTKVCHLERTDTPIILLSPSLSMGGAERHAVVLANALSSHYKVVFVYLKKEDNFLGKEINRERGIQIHCMSAKRSVDFGAIKALANTIEASAARIIICTNPHALRYAYFARLLCSSSLRFVEVFHSTNLPSWKDHLRMLFNRPLFWFADDLVYVCEAQRKYWRERGYRARRDHVIHNGVDCDQFDPAAYSERQKLLRSKYGFETDDKVVGICARLRPEKAHTDLLRAVKLLRNSGVFWKVLIVGDGPTKKLIEREIELLGLGDAVSMIGARGDVREAISVCDAMAIVSTSIETFSIAVLEGMAMAKPIIISDIGGAREQVRHGVEGYVFQPRDVHQLAECLGRLSDRLLAESMGKAARRRVKTNFSEVKMVGRYIQLIEMNSN